MTVLLQYFVKNVFEIMNSSYITKITKKKILMFLITSEILKQ